MRNSGRESERFILDLTNKFSSSPVLHISIQAEKWHYGKPFYYYDGGGGGRKYNYRHDSETD